MVTARILAVGPGALPEAPYLIPFPAFGPSEKCGGVDLESNALIGVGIGVMR